MYSALERKKKKRKKYESENKKDEKEDKKRWKDQSIRWYNYFNQENWRFFNIIVKSCAFKNLSSALWYKERFWIDIWALLWAKN